MTGTFIKIGGRGVLIYTLHGNEWDDNKKKIISFCYVIQSKFTIINCVEPFQAKY